MAEARALDALLVLLLLRLQWLLLLLRWWWWLVMLLLPHHAWRVIAGIRNSHLSVLACFMVSPGSWDTVTSRWCGFPLTA